MRPQRLPCLVLGFLVVVSLGCRPATIEEEAAPTVVVPTAVNTQIPPAAVESAEPPPTATAPLLPTPRPTVTLVNAPPGIPENWQEIGLAAEGLTMATPADWVDIASLSNVASLADKFGQTDILFLADSLDTGIEVLTGRMLGEGGFVISFRAAENVPAFLDLQGNEEPAAALNAILRRAGVAFPTAEPLNLSGMRGAFIELNSDPTGIILGDANQVQLRLSLLFETDNSTPIFVFMGSSISTWETYEPIFNYMLETIAVRNRAIEGQEGVRFLDTSAAGGGSDTLSGELQAGTSDFWAFEAEAGAFATLIVTPRSASTDLTLTLLAPSGQTLLTEDDGFAGDSEVISDFFLPESGIYLLEVSEFFNASDTYSISVILSENEVYSGGGQISLNQEIEAILQPDVEDVWLFSGQAGQVISIVLTPASEFDARFTLYSPDGREVATFDEGYSGDAELLAGYTLPITGEYRIVVRSFAENGGRYSLALDEGEESAINFYEAGDLEYGATQREQLQKDEVHAWFISGLAGDEIILDVTPITENLDLDVWLLDPEARRLVMQDDALAGESERIAFTLVRDGEYIVVVQDFFGESGEYEISLMVSGDNYLMNAGEIAYGQTVENRLESGRGVIYTFQGQAQDRVTVRVTPKDGESDLVVSLRDPQARPLLQVDETLAGNDEVLIFELTDSGEWVVVIQEYSDAGGEYTLSLEGE